ncbi:MAG TPA: GIY-YIG nuclease family protein [Sphingomicrobium sp.]
MQFWVYLLRCADGSYYTGQTDNLEARLAQHEQGLCCDWTRRRRPVELVWCEAAPTRDEALAFERRVKGWTRAKKEALIASDWDRISWLARAPRERPSTSLRTNDEATCTDEPIRPERSAKRVVDRREAQASDRQPVRPERSAKRVVEGRRR